MFLGHRSQNHKCFWDIDSKITNVFGRYIPKLLMLLGYRSQSYKCFWDIGPKITNVFGISFSSQKTYEIWDVLKKSFFLLTEGGGGEALCCQTTRQAQCLVL